MNIVRQVSSSAYLEIVPAGPGLLNRGNLAPSGEALFSPRHLSHVAAEVPARWIVLAGPWIGSIGSSRKGDRRTMQIRWFQLVAVVAALLVFTACGRVNLEDLTPEAVKTQQAEAFITATAEASQQEALGDEFTGNPQRGKVQYDVWCTGCHDGGRAAPIVGQAYPFSEYEEFFRTGGTIEHPNYNPVTDLSDQNLIDILTYVATAK